MKISNMAGEIPFRKREHRNLATRAQGVKRPHWLLFQHVDRMVITWRSRFILTLPTVAT